MNKILFARETALRAIALAYAVVFSTAAADKIRTTVPDWFLQQFQSTFLARVPGLLEVSFFGIALTEAFLAIAFIAAIFSRQNPRTSAILRAALLGSVLLFTALCFGQRITGKYDGAADLFMQAILSFFVLQYVDHRQPERTA